MWVDFSHFAVKVEKRIKLFVCFSGQYLITVRTVYDMCIIHVQLPGCAALIQTRDGGMEVVPDEQQLPAQRGATAVIATRAASSWWAPGHPGWMIFTLGGRHFDSLEEVMQVPGCWGLEPVRQGDSGYDARLVA